MLGKEGRSRGVGVGSGVGGVGGVVGVYSRRSRSRRRRRIGGEGRNKYKPRTEKEQHLPIRHAGRPADLSMLVQFPPEQGPINSASW